VVRPIDRKRWRQRLTARLEDFPRQLDTLRYSTQRFEPDFDRAAFAAAFESENPELYSRVQAVERGYGRLQNYVAEIAIDAVNLAELSRRPHEGNEPQAAPFFEALRDDGVLSKDLTRGLVRTQRSRALFEHDYVKVSARDVHEAVLLLLDAAPAFLTAVVPFVEALLVPRR
jgi:uncharacterized protein YutE (UPF0331/DUF86 family)